MTINSIDDYFFGPLGKEYCFLFKAFTIVAFLSIVMLIVTVVSTLIMSKGKMDYKPLIFAFPLFLSYLIIYFQNRILHSMCMKSL